MDSKKTLKDQQKEQVSEYTFPEIKPYDKSLIANGMLQRSRAFLEIKSEPRFDEIKEDLKFLKSRLPIEDYVGYLMGTTVLLMKKVSEKGSITDFFELISFYTNEIASCSKEVTDEDKMR